MVKQQCYLAVIYLNWAILIGGVWYLLFTHHYVYTIAWLLLLPIAMWLYIRLFPSISGAMGYGSVDDLPAVPPSFGNARSEIPTVKLYTALGCPFCPIVKRRLEALRAELKFKFEEIDVTLRPDLVATKKIRAVPVIEIADHRMQGNVSSEQLSELLCAKAAGARVPAG